MQDFKVLSCEDKVASNNKPYKALEIQDETGNTVKVNIFSEYPEFANIKEGSVIKGQLVKKGQYTNLVSATQATRTTNPGYKSKMMNEAMARKEQSIGRAQENKGQSIKIASTIRMAVDLAISEYEKNPNSLDNLDTLIKKWREHLWHEWDKWESIPPFD